MERALPELRAACAGCGDAARRAELGRHLEALERRAAAHGACLEAERAEAERARLLDAPQADKAARRRPAAASEDEAQRAETAELLKARDMMRSGLERMQSVGSSLSDTSSTIRKTQSQYTTYEDRLRSAAAVLGQLKRRTEDDSKYIWRSFLFFVIVVAYIFLKRVKVFKVMYLAGSWTMWSGSTAAGIVHSLVDTAISVGDTLGSALGISTGSDPLEGTSGQEL
ncbi:unnamed protein product [Prorocentrum cordatum]|uniref:Sec20 C-terminal domain-containing protein n=1 Tax=Prorocentrum cordatum TaxID=2364126 RepID=A0ABN9WNX9_9DINO|nr:unnamed protein product [Polarella glacialis]